MTKSKFPPKKPEQFIFKARVKHNWSEYQKNIFKDISKGLGHTIVIARAGSAKCLGKGTPVLLFDGSIKNVEDITINDLLMGPDSKPRKVLSCNKGYGNLVKIIPTKGDSWICNIDHILTLKGTNREKGRIIDISVKDLRLKYSHYKTISKNWKLFKSELINFQERKVPYDPYFIGLWLGDGTSTEASISNIEPEVIEYCNNFGIKNNYLVRMYYNAKHNYYNIRFAIGKRGAGHRGTPHYLKRYLLKTCNDSLGKVIPDDYLYNSEENRLQLLAGIIDTDGTYPKGGGYFEVSSSNEKLANQYLYLARSLGFASYIKKSKTSIKSIGFTGYAWKISIIGDINKIPTKVVRKQAPPRAQIKNPLVNGFEIKDIGDGDYYGFTLDDDGRFLLGDFTVTHNTSTLVEGSRYIPKGKKSLFCAFNKSIQEELKSRLGSYVECSTLHSLGFRGIKQRFGNNIELDNNKCWNIVENLIGNKNENYDLIDNVVKTVDFCKSNLVDTPSKIDELIVEYGIDLCEISPEQFIKYVSQTLRLCKENTASIDFNDMIWFPFVYRINVGKYDYVFVDESQDMSKCMIELALSAVKPDGRVIAVLDPRQAIYSWRGADSRVLNNLKTRLNPKELKLPICYRCPKKVVALAQTLVEDILPYEDSPEGEIIDLDISQLESCAKPGDYVISRLNAPLIKHCFMFLKHNIPANILGRDIGDGLLYLIKKSKKKKVTELLKWLAQWEKQEKENLLAKYPKANIEVIADKAECIRMLCEDASTIEEVKENIGNLFKDNEEKNIVLFSSVHKIKGKETNNVFVLADTLRSHTEEELNIQYVAFTRSKSKLYLVRKPGKYDQYDDKPKDAE